MVVGTASGWTGTRLKNVATINGRSLGNETSPDYTFRYLEISNVNNQGVISEDAISEMTFEGSPSRARRVVQDRDTVISSVRPNLQAVAFIENGGRDLVASTGFYVVSPLRHNLYEKFAYYILLSDGSRQHFEAVAKGVGYPAVDDKDFGTLKFYLPPVAEQQRIVAYLDKACEAINGAISAKRQQLEVLDNLRKSIIHNAVTRGLDERVDLVESGNETIGLMPRLWKRTKFRYEIDVRSGDFVSDKLDDDGAYPVIGGNGLMGRAQDFNVDGEVVVVGRVGAYCGNVHYVKGRAWVSDNALIVESRHDKRFLTYLLRALDLNSFAKKTAQPLVTGTQIKNSHVALPPVDEQRQIVEYLESKSARIKDLESNLSAQITALEQYRKSLVHECVTGKRRIE